MLRYAAQPALEKVFESNALRDKAKRDKKIREAVKKFGHTRRAVAVSGQSHKQSLFRSYSSF